MLSASDDPRVIGWKEKSVLGVFGLSHVANFMLLLPESSMIFANEIWGTDVFNFGCVRANVDRD